MAKSTTRQTMARERARAARLRVDAERAKRDAKVEDHAAAFFDALDARAALLVEVDEREREMGRAVADLLALDEPRGRVADLLEINAKELRRLLDLIEKRDGGAPSTVVRESEDSQPESSQTGTDHPAEDEAA